MANRVSAAFGALSPSANWRATSPSRALRSRNTSRCWRTPASSGGQGLRCL